MKYLILSICTFFFPLLAYAQESETVQETYSSVPLTVNLSIWEILFALLAPITLFAIAYLLITKFKL